MSANRTIAGNTMHKSKRLTNTMATHFTDCYYCLLFILHCIVYCYYIVFMYLWIMYLYCIVLYIVTILYLCIYELCIYIVLYCILLLYCIYVFMNYVFILYCIVLYIVTILYLWIMYLYCIVLFILYIVYFTDCYYCLQPFKTLWDPPVRYRIWFNIMKRWFFTQNISDVTRSRYSATS
jgi:hypothetical protein